jgi:ethanolamine utilization protein EutN
VFIAKVIGTIWATIKDKNLNGFKIQIIQPLNSKQEEIGNPIMAVDTIGAGSGELVMYITAREAVIPMGVKEAPVDASIVGIIEKIDLYK